MNTLTIEEIRHANLLLLIEENGGDSEPQGEGRRGGGGQTIVAQLCGTSSIYLNQIINRQIKTNSGKPPVIGSKLARKLEEGCGKPEGWMDVNHNVDPAQEEWMKIYHMLGKDGRAALLEKARELTNRKRKQA